MKVDINGGIERILSAPALFERGEQLVAEISHLFVKLQNVLPAFIRQVDGIVPPIVDGRSQKFASGKWMRKRRNSTHGYFQISL
jgi:hypothetical protein